MRPVVRLVPRSTFLALFLGATACASSGGSSDGPRRNPDVITQEELADLQLLDALQVVQRLRPRWLRIRAGALPETVVNGSRIEGQAEALRNYRVGEIRELRYLSPADATLRFGTGYPAGAILVTTGR